MTEPVILRHRGAVAEIRFHRPERMNAVDVASGHAFLAHCRAVADDAAVRAVVVSGEGRAFGVGGDLTALDGDPVARAPILIGPMHEAIALLGEMNKPVIASLHGLVFGGSLSVALACDLAVAAAGTQFNLAYVKIGATCDGGASWTLPRLVGVRNALAIAFLAETFDAEEALRLGIVQKVVAAGASDDAALELAARLAAGPTQAIAGMKRLMRTSMAHGFREQLALEQAAFVRNAATADFGEGIGAFLARRQPVYEGR